MDLTASKFSRVEIIDSHTAGEPTRLVIAGGPDLGSGTLAERLSCFRTHHDSFRSGIVGEPRGSEVIVGALLCPPTDPASAAGVIFFNDVGYLGMCGHGTIGLVRTLSHLGRMAAGRHRIETPVGPVTVELHDDMSVSVENVPSYRYRENVSVNVPDYGRVVGEIAWGGNWFFLVSEHRLELAIANRARLVEVTTAIRSALVSHGTRGEDGAPIDHIELCAPPSAAENSGRNFVLCPGASFDRSPCGTGTSAKMACLYASGKTAPGEIWRQEGILGTVFEGSFRVEQGRIVPTIRGSAWITAETTLLFDSADPFRDGIAL